ncbi:MAG TPA: helix-turn-helix domain-containing protein [Thermodesulfobacteriota bacterium]
MARALEKGCRILEALGAARDGATLLTLSRTVGLPKPTVARLLGVLETHRLVEHDKATARYRLGMGFVQLGQMRLEAIELRAIAAPHMRALMEQTRETVHLGVLEGGRMVYILVLGLLAFWSATRVLLRLRRQMHFERE